MSHKSEPLRLELELELLSSLLLELELSLLELLLSLLSLLSLLLEELLPSLEELLLLLLLDSSSEELELELLAMDYAVFTCFSTYSFVSFERPGAKETFLMAPARF